MRRIRSSVFANRISLIFNLYDEEASGKRSLLPSDYDEHIEDTYFAAEARGEVDEFRDCLEYALTHPEEALSRGIGIMLAFRTEDQIRDILRYAYRKLWPERTMPTKESTRDIVLDLEQ